MSATTSATAPSTAPTGAPARTRRPLAQWLTAATWHLRSLLRIMVWIWAAAALFIVAVLVVLSQVAGEIPTLSAVSLSHQALLWIPTGFIGGIASTGLELHVASGMTRRSFVIASSVAALGVGLFNAAVGTVLLLVERAVYDELGWTHGSAMTNAEVFAGGEATYALGLALMFCAAILIGLLAGTSFYRFGVKRGFMLLPLSLAPLLVVSLVGVDYSTQWGLWGTGPNLPSSPLLGVAAIALGLVGYSALVRRVPIAPVTA